MFLDFLFEAPAGELIPLLTLLLILQSPGFLFLLPLRLGFLAEAHFLLVSLPFLDKLTVSFLEPMADFRFRLPVRLFIRFSSGLFFRPSLGLRNGVSARLLRNRLALCVKFRSAAFLFGEGNGLR
jgi:hypothetical protein